jgi:hypothetical protein
VSRCAPAALITLGLAAVVACERAAETPIGRTEPQLVTPAPAGVLTVDVHFTSDEQPVAVPRDVPRDAPLHGALRAQLAGPTPAERAEGLASWFADSTASMLRGVELDEAGRAVVDFDDFSRIIPGASSSAGSALLLNELNATVFQFAEVREVEYRFEGDCDAFWNWLQRACQVVRRGERFP